MNNVLTPQGEAELADMVRQAAGDKTGLEIRGGGTRIGLGRPVQGAKTLSLANISGISLYEPGALTIVAGAGTPLSEIEKTLAEKGQRLPFEPMDHRSLFGTTGEPTIGGVVAANVSGPRRIQAGACRDSLIGVRFVSGTGEVIKNGGRVMKNVTGLDLVKLMAGSYGTLGVLSEVSFKVLPAPGHQATLGIEGLALKEAIGVLSAALSTPFEISGAAHFPRRGQASLTLLRVEGFESQLEYRLEKLKADLAKSLESRIIRAEEHDRLWRSVRDLEMFADTDEAVWKLSVKPSDAPAIAEAIHKQTTANMLFDWGGGLIWVGVEKAPDAHEPIIRQTVARFGGHATLVRAPNDVRLTTSPFHPEPRVVEQLSGAVRLKFDPAGILNPGRMMMQGAG